MSHPVSYMEGIAMPKTGMIELKKKKDKEKYGHKGEK